MLKTKKALYFVLFLCGNIFFHLENFRYNQPSTTTSGIAPTSSMPVWGVNQNEISHYLAARLNGSPLSNERKHIVSLQPGLLRSAELSWVESSHSAAARHRTGCCHFYHRHHLYYRRHYRRHPKNGFHPLCTLCSSSIAYCTYNFPWLESTVDITDGSNHVFNMH